MNGSSLRAKLGAGVAVGAVVLLILGFVVFQRAQTLYVAQVVEQFDSSAHLEESRVEQRLAFQAKAVDAVAVESDIQGSTRLHAHGSLGASDELAIDLSRFVQASPQFAAAAVVRSDGTVVASSDDIMEIPTELDVSAVEPVFGDPYLPAGAASGRVPIVVTIDTGPSPDAYHLVVDYDLSDIQDLVAAYEEIGQTWESHIAWRTGDGDAEFVTRLRFEQDAAFNKTVPGDREGVPIVQAVNGFEGVLVDVPDYRQEPSILAIRTVDPVGWGLVVKADYAEALRPFTSVRTLWFVLIAAATAVVVGVLWFSFDRIGRRLARFARAAQAVGKGDFSRRINDPHMDELGRVAAEFDRATDVLSSAIDEKARFVATVSHELRTPLAAVIGLADMLANQVEHLSEDEQASTAKQISIQSNELGSLVDDLLVVASTRNGSLMVDATELYVCDIVRVLMKQLPSDLADKIEIEVSETLPATADWKRTKQILRNLLTNAHKYGGDRIRLMGERNGDMVSIAILDNGAGVEADLQERIFLAFERGSHGSADSVGLGLNIARELAERMGGSLEYERVKGWTAFTLTLPSADIEALTPLVS